MDMDRETKKKFIVAGIISIILVIIAIISRSVLPLIPIFSAIGGFLIIIFGWEFGMEKHYKKVVYFLVLANIIIFIMFLANSCDSSTPKVNKPTTEQEGTSPAETTTEETTTEQVTSKKEKPSKEKPSKEKPSKEETTSPQESYTDGIISTKPVETTTSELENSPNVEELTTKKEKQTKAEVETSRKKKPTIVEPTTKKKKPSKPSKEEATTPEIYYDKEVVEPNYPFEETTTIEKQTTEEYTTEEQTTEEETTEEQTTEIAPQIDVNISHTVGAANANVLVVVSEKIDNINFLVRLDSKEVPASNYTVYNNNDGTYSLKVPVNKDNNMIHVVVRDGSDELVIQMGFVNY